MSKKVLLLTQLWGRYFRKPWRLFEKVLSDPKNSLKSSISDQSLLGALSVMETLDSTELLMEDQAWLDYLWDFETREINLDLSSDTD